MRRNFIWSSAIALAVAMSSVSHASIIEFSFEDRGTASFNTETFGSLLENTLLSDLPVTITLNPDTGNSSDATSGNQGDERPVPLQITAIAGTGTGAGAHFNGSTSEFGIDSDGTTGDDSTALDAGLNESLTLSFSEDLFLREIDFNSLSGADRFSIQVDGSSPIIIAFDDTSGFAGEFTFTGGTTPSAASGLFVAAGTGVEFRATVGSVGLDNLIVEIAATVPEPSSMLALMGLAGLLAVKRRR